MTRPTALRKSALEGRGVVVLLSSSSSSGGVVLRAVVVPHLAHYPESVLCSIHFLSRSLSRSEKRRKRRLLLATVTSVAGMKSSIVCALSLSLSASQKVATKRVNLKPLLFSPFQTSGKRSKTPQSLLFCTARITRKTFAHRKRIREREREMMMMMRRGARRRLLASIVQMHSCSSSSSSSIPVGGEFLRSDSSSSSSSVKTTNARHTPRWRRRDGVAFAEEDGGSPSAAPIASSSNYSNARRRRSFSSSSTTAASQHYCSRTFLEREFHHQHHHHDHKRRAKTTMTSSPSSSSSSSSSTTILEEEEEGEEEDPDPDNPANAKPKGPIGQAFDFLSAVALVCATAVAAVAGASYYVQTTEELEKKVRGKDFEKEIAVPGAQRFAEYLLEFRQFIDEKSSHYLDPISDKLLPDHPPDAMYIPHTLVLDLDDTLINSNWNRERGWRVFKRPGVDPFLEHLAQFYEMVVFTDQLLTYGEPILERLDPKRYVTHRLYRESAQYKHGEYIRDLSKLNRDMERVLYISSKPKSAEMNPENVIPIQPWRYEDGSTDTALLDLMPFLESIVRLGVADVRAVLSSYKEEMKRTGKDIPHIFRERQQKFQKKRLEQAKQVAPIGRGRKKIDAW